MQSVDVDAFSVGDTQTKPVAQQLTIQIDIGGKRRFSALILLALIVIRMCFCFQLCAAGGRFVHTHIKQNRTQPTRIDTKCLQTRV